MTTLMPVTGLGIPDPVPPRRRWSTPLRLKALTVLAVVLAVAFGALVSATAADLRGGLRRGGAREAPRSLAAADLRIRLGELDSVLAPPVSAGARDRDENARVQARDRFQRALSRANADLRELAAARAAADETRTLMDGLGRYQVLAAAAAGEGRAADRAARHREAAALMRETLLPAARRLADSAHRDLDRTYRETRRSASGTATAANWLGLALLAVLGPLNVALTRRHRRLINPAAAAASVLALALVAQASGMMRTQADGLRTIKAGPYEAARVFSEVRASERTGEPAAPGSPDRAARLKEASLYTATIAKDVSAADEEFLRARRQDGTAQAWEAYDRLLATLTDVNRRDLDRRVGAGLREAEPWVTLPLGGAVLLSALLIAGVRPRLAEYR
ncbi:hypothetical protein [Spirillospora sp. NPDC029432]|uniref:hypothetical protein n=1 Tax=Spirillospora sp. NPDC029432 TaxID=3154599 RepID=UPI003452EC79